MAADTLQGEVCRALDPMKLFLDSADCEQWKLPPGAPPVQGVTTNPTLVKQAGLPVSLGSYCQLLEQAVSAGMAELMLQLPSPELQLSMDWATQLTRLAQQSQLGLTMKLPCHPQWEDLARALRSEGVPILLTGLANPVQLLWAQGLGANFVAPYLGRLHADGRDVWALVKACIALQTDGPQLVAASIKTADVLAQLIAQGAYAATVRPEFVSALVVDELTLAAMAQFDADTVASTRHNPPT